jgi:hypothetical protein
MWMTEGQSKLKTQRTQKDAKVAKEDVPPLSPPGEGSGVREFGER